MPKVYDKTLHFITDHGHPAEIIDTHYGKITRYQWQLLECERIGNCYIHTRPDNFIAIVSDIKSERITTTDLNIRDSKKFRRSLRYAKRRKGFENVV
jgi:hypothetical protein